ncbi:hypothetical protein GA0116948_102408 [Chitinophaga costaii]|uniref:Spermatogenesis-associated protein 20-like TRX domain-containing protein n=1 Tax=Chitinophaga costaii TaxID=1335309 RepID=A0A1C4B3K4_9BACT|nr:thioredoxin domain-containing protein [Chitinophaga costaii]PUZ26854.1 thioredoxin domain-containing protein [Chitinophaga costaii]SCC01453.1 hypothetical protein GA0116948_102408 [Chitinophaga costaii]
MNRLAQESSPYLLQHAHNPVDWYPWGEEALERARHENKPILVSIGYAACHWCHVMERESFENEATAALMNQYFINIKIDREERPDLDHIYMDAVQAMTGQGGWPLNVFLLPDTRPFYGGTYFPPKAMFNRASWTDVLHSIRQAYVEKRGDLEAQATQLISHMTNSNAFGLNPALELNIPRQELFTQDQCHDMYKNIMAQADQTWGGFGRAPKFPGSFNIQYLLRYGHFFKQPAATAQARLSLDKMIQGGIYDQLGGGFARYATDEKWLAPHFEKMLYDNALLVDTLSEAYQLTQDETYAEAIQHTLAFIETELQDASGGWYAALDADSEGVEGKFYTWSKEEIENILIEKAQLFCDFYGVQEGGNWEHTNILWIPETLEIFASKNHHDKNWLKQVLGECRAALLEERKKRVHPGLDDKILLGWNALLMHAYCKAYAALGHQPYLDAAVKNAAFCWAQLKKPGTDAAFFHTWKAGLAKYPAFLDDYAWLIRGMIALQEATGELQYLENAKLLTEHVIHAFSDEQHLFFYYTSAAQKDVIVRKKEIYDGAVPSGNSIMAANLWYLALVYDRPEWSERAVKMGAQLSQTLARYPTSFGVWCNFVLQLVVGTREIAIVGGAFRDRLKDIGAVYIPFRVLLGAEKDRPDYPLLRNREQEGQTLIYVCENYYCLKPVKDIREIIKLI